LISGLSLAAGCGGGSSNNSSTGTGTGTSSTSVAGGNTIVTSGNNVALLIVDGGPPKINFLSVNTAFTTVVVCAPGSAANCVTIDHVAVDTGSTGLRIPASAFASFTNGAAVLAALQNVNASTPVAECVQFLDGSFIWGAVKSADVKMGGSGNTGEVAAGVPIHVLGDASVPSGASIPSTCSTVTSLGGTQTAGTEENTVAALGANGLLGVGNFQYDCDILGQANPCVSASTVPSGTYYTCTGSSCSPSGVSVAEQVRNPVSLFAVDNNGVILELPAVPAGGQLGISAGQGSLVFGIGTESNNGLSSSAVVLTLDSNPNDAAWLGFTTVFNGVSYPNSLSAIGSFLDSGSNIFRFLDQPTSKIPNCPINTDFYCPAATESLTAVNQAANGNSHAVQFSVANADTLFTGSDSAFSNLAAPNTPGSPNSATQAADGFFDWGLPFFYGRNVYTAIWQVSPPSGVPAGPFWAY
jgi:hypothetical protein